MEQVLTIGIDLGTSKTCLGIYKLNESRIEILEGSYGRQLVNYVSVQSNDIKTGGFVKSKIRTNYQNVIYDSKILIGKTKIDSRIEQIWPFECIFNDKTNEFVIKLLNGLFLTPQKITSFLLGRLKEELLKSECNINSINPVITVPVIFNLSQRHATLEAARLAGLTNVNLINDSTAASLAIVNDYHFDSSLNKNILIFDLGAYYLNFCVFECNKSKSFIEIKNIASYENSGGHIINLNMLKHVIKTNSNRIDFQNKKFIQVLYENCEKVKHLLSDSNQAGILIESIFEDDQDFEFLFTRDLFEDLNSKLFQAYIVVLKKFLNEIRLEKDDIDQVFLIGGGTYIPKIRKSINEFFNHKKRLNLSMNAIETLAYGATFKSAFNLIEKSIQVYELNLHEYKLEIFSNQIKHGILIINSKSKVPEEQRLILDNLDDRNTKLTFLLYENGILIHQKQNYKPFSKYVLVCLELDASCLIRIRIENNKNCKIYLDLTKEEKILREKNLKNKTYELIKKLHLYADYLQCFDTHNKKLTYFYENLNEENQLVKDLDLIENHINEIEFNIDEDVKNIII